MFSLARPIQIPVVVGFYPGILWPRHLARGVDMLSTCCGRSHGAICKLGSSFPADLRKRRDTIHRTQSPPLTDTAASPNCVTARFQQPACKCLSAGLRPADGPGARRPGGDSVRAFRERINGATLETIQGGMLTWLSASCAGSPFLRSPKYRFLTSERAPFHTEFSLQLSFKNGLSSNGASQRATLDQLREGEAALLDRIDLPEDEARRLMELGFLPGTRIIAAHRSPFGDPRVFRVDGSEVALRRETAAHLVLRVNGHEAGHERLP